MNELVRINDVSVHFPTRSATGRRAVLHAVEQISVTVQVGETLALVGESGSGKTTLGHVVAGLRRPTKGSIKLEGDPADTSRAGYVQIIFQDPFSALDPRMLVADIVAEPLHLAGNASRRDRRAKAMEVLRQVGLAEDAGNRYPHEFSGGQRQRIAIARAIISNPGLVVADEPLSALDVSIQSQVLNLLKDIQEERALSYLFISHDLTVVHHIADRVAIMYLGRLMEIGPRDEVFETPSHPYTVALLEAMPRIGARRREKGASLKGEIPSPVNPPSGCVFHTRCPRAQAICSTEVPQLLPAPGRQSLQSACHFKV